MLFRGRDICDDSVYALGRGKGVGKSLIQSSYWLHFVSLMGLEKLFFLLSLSYLSVLKTYVTIV